MDNAPEHFTRVAAATLEPKPPSSPSPFPATEARFVKLRVLSGASARVLEIAEVRVLESAREGYVPLFNRAPGAKLWKGSPREAAQRGLDWLQQSAVDWDRVHSGASVATFRRRRSWVSGGPQTGLSREHAGAARRSRT